MFHFVVRKCLSAHLLMRQLPKDKMKSGGNRMYAQEISEQAHDRGL